MMNFKYIYIIVAFVFLAACGYEPEVERAGSRPDVSTEDILDARGYNILGQAITHAGLDEVLQGSDSITILAPSDLAFEALLSDLGVGSITDVPAETVAGILSYHVIGSPVFSSGLPRKTTALDGNTMYFSTAGAVSVNGKSTVVEADIVSRTAVIHGINKVLDVPAGNLFQQMQADDSLTTLVSAIQAAGLESLFTGSTEYTVFTPTNSAFDGVDVAALTPEQLVDILGFHVVSGVSFAQELPGTGRIASIQGTSAGDNVQEIVKEDAFLNGSEIIGFNTTANNGVLHKVGSIISKQSTIFDVFGPANITGLDQFGFDQFGDVVSGAGYSYSLADTLSIYAPLFGPTYADFASDAEATAYIENHTFSGRRNIWTLDNGTKISSINGNSYYITVGLVGGTSVRYVNGGPRNAFTSGGIPTTTVQSAYFATLGLPNAVFTPLPEENIVEVLSSNADYSLFVALVDKLGLTATLSGGDLTVFPVNNATFTAGTGLSTVADIVALNEEDDAGFLADLAEIASNHVVASVHFSMNIASFLPSLETLGETNLQFAIVNVDGADEIRIITDPAFPNSSNVGLVSVDETASNGVIHEVDNFIIF